MVGNNIGLKDLVEVSKEGDENEEITSTDFWSMGCEQNGDYLLGKFYELLYVDDRKVNSRKHGTAYVDMGVVDKQSVFAISVSPEKVKEVIKKEPTFNHLMFDTWKWFEFGDDELYQQGRWVKDSEKASHVSFKIKVRLWKFDMG